ncbi:RagB/SusD family nutrient uptake outer membrane protein [Larkinella terrae]|uniref:RagB/SusD family nutrient uptake outer membrane protein n=1 Tax=Larkinella terrae TaxID=2025311 RepID=A0A7K0EEX6_9BACT|nr:RagB/SusD family nutrient uptake outer membrane protein [Larkinella terrae]MRS60383.1 RagB/SusD family nutrient uptake outer membrane protein [Larkinella terrae]
MKKFLIISLVSTASLLLTACQDFLDKNPLDQLSNQTFWTTEKDADMAIAGVYSQLLSLTYDHHRMDWDALTDDFFLFGTYQRVDNIAKGIIEPATGGLVSTVYLESYKGVTACNVFLANIDRVTMDEAKKNRYKGEVLFLRALFYFTLTEFYGGVPLYTKPITLAEAAVKQSPKATVIEQVIKDLDDAIALLPATLYTSHAVKGSALALKAKVLMHNNKWQEAADAANLVIQSKVFKLATDYQTMFLTKGQTNNPEIMFSARYLNPDRFSSESPDMKYGNAAAINGSQNFVDEFECTDGLPISQSPLYDKTAYKKNRDPRLDYTIRDIKEQLVSSTGVKFTNTAAGIYTSYLVRKYVDPENLPFSYSTRSDQDYILTRYAEVLLIYAEAKNEASGPDQSVYDAVNAVRARVKMPALPTGLTQATLRDRIRHERRVELGAEGYRYLDIKRWKIAEKVIPGIVDPGGVLRKFDPAKHYLFPFPQSEIDINKNLTQNPGY